MDIAGYMLRGKFFFMYPFFVENYYFKMELLHLIVLLLQISFYLIKFP